MKITVRGADKVMRSFDVLGRAVEDFRPLWEVLANEIRLGTMVEFSTQGGSSGGWAALSPAYALYKGRVRPGMPLLVFDGDLRSSVTDRSADDHFEEMTPDTLTYGTTDVKAAAHQFGYPPRNLPARPFLEVPDKQVEHWQKLATDWAQEEIDEAFG